MAVDIEAINARVKQQSRFLDAIRTEIGRVIVGQTYMIDRLLIALLCDGHILIEEKGYSKIARCPKCDRLDMELPRYTGVVHLKSEEEMAREIADRRSVVFDQEYRLERGREVVRELIAIANGPRVRTGRPEQVLAGIAPVGIAPVAP